MKLRIGNLDFDIAPIGKLDRFHQRLLAKALKETQNQQIYFWRCGNPGKATFLPPARKPGLVPLLNQVSFGRSSSTGFGPGLSGRDTRKAQREFLAATGLTNLRALLGRINRTLRQPIIKVQLDTYDWMKPLASFVVNLETEYALFGAVNADRSVSFRILVPHKAVFSAEVVDYCDAAAFGRLEEQPETPKPDEPLEVLLPAGNDRNREWRCAAIKQELDRLAFLQLMPSVLEAQKKSRELKKELKELCGD